MKNEFGMQDKIKYTYYIISTYLEYILSGPTFYFLLLITLRKIATIRDQWEKICGEYVVLIKVY